MKTTQKKLKR
ncbi:hypothetical protein HZS_4023 [Henneguya salminicola]|nr:hypothetical protein HZS_4023 [Henneguya salminicola]